MNATQIKVALHTYFNSFRHILYCQIVLKAPEHWLQYLLSSIKFLSISNSEKVLQYVLKRFAHYQYVGLLSIILKYWQCAGGIKPRKLRGPRAKFHRTISTSHFPESGAEEFQIKTSTLPFRGIYHNMIRTKENRDPSSVMGIRISKELVSSISVNSITWLTKKGWFFLVGK